MQLDQKHLDAMKLLGSVENEEFLIILANYFRAKAEFEKSVSELEEDLKVESNNLKKPLKIVLLLDGEEFQS